MIPANQTLSALKSMQVPRTGGRVTVIQQFSLHAEGALMTNEYTARLEAMSKSHARQAYASAMSDGRKGFPQALRSNQLLGTT